MWPRIHGSSNIDVASLPPSPVSKQIRYRSLRSLARYGRTVARDISYSTPHFPTRLPATVPETYPFSRHEFERIRQKIVSALVNLHDLAGLLFDCYGPLSACAMARLF